MNYYDHHIGDYAEATYHLSFVEDAAYSRMIRKYYSTEKPLPAEISQVQRLVGAKTKEEKNSVEVVLKEFFILEEDGWHNKRCDLELDKYREGSAEREQKTAHEKERLRRYREDRARLFDELRAAGVTPKWDIKYDQLKRLHDNTCTEPVLSTGHVQHGTCTEPETHLQRLTNSHSPVPNIKPTSQPYAGARFAMLSTWRPSDHLPDLARQAGVEIRPEKLGEFIAHWLTQPLTQRTQAEWDKALLQSAKHDRLHTVSGPPGKSARKPDNFDQRDYGEGVMAL